MIFHNFIYALKGILRERSGVFWAGLFPFILGTLFYVSFGKAYDSEMYHEIPVGIVTIEDNPENQNFQKIIQEIEDQEHNKMFQVRELTKQEAKKKLEKEEIDGYYLVDKDISLVLLENGVNQTILHVFLERYQQQVAMVQEVAKTNPQNISKLVEAWEEELEYYTEVNQSNGNMDSMVQYFYALIAMSSLFASYLSLNRTVKMQANISAIGARRGVTPTKKSIVVFSEFAACLLVQFLIDCVLLVYLVWILGIDMGGRLLYFLPVFLLGSAIGVSIGILIGSIPKMSEAARQGLNTSICLFMSFLSGLMIHLIKQIIEDYAPMINRINPAALIVDSLYSLNVYDTLERYWRNLGILAAMTFLICTASILLTRRMKYASL